MGITETVCVLFNEILSAPIQGRLVPMWRLDLGWTSARGGSLAGNDILIRNSSLAWGAKPVYINRISNCEPIFHWRFLTTLWPQTWRALLSHLLAFSRLL